LAANHYAVHQGKPFYQSLVEYIVSGPIVAMVWEGKNAVAAARMTMGGTNPSEAAPGTIRGDFGMEIGRNLVHGSDSPENAVKEVGLFFTADELVDWQRDSDPWIRE
jgi:nucleoside-diphosphate kinase